MSSNPQPLSLFAGFGVELEYMIVDAQSLSVLPVTDRLFHSVTGQYQTDVERGPLAWSNELALHVVELKTNGPAQSLAGLADRFQESVCELNGLLAPLGGRLMPTGMHPWMDPWKETKLWPHEYNAVYEAFNRVFDCRGHGWSNLQSLHLNLPFANDAEFERLHAAIRVLLPLLPAVAASSPFQDGQPAAHLDNRLQVYRSNSLRVPSITGRVIPEPVFSRQHYESEILQRIYRDIAPFDPHGTLQEEWLNARGAIARFERNTIEIRLLDVQECPAADLAIAQAVVAVLRELIRERWTSLDSQKRATTESLEQILLSTIQRADRAVIDDPNFLELFGLDSIDSPTAGQIWRSLSDALGLHTLLSSFAERTAWTTTLDRGPLARRLTGALSPSPSPQELQETYRDLCDCLQHGRVFPNSH